MWWEGVVKNPIWSNFKAEIKSQKWKYNYLDTVPSLSLLICNSTADSICGTKKDVKKWIAAVVFPHPEMLKVFVSVLIWEYSSPTLKTLCPYCDPCDSFKVIPFQTNIIPNSRVELEKLVQESKQLNPDPHSVEVLLRYGTSNFDVRLRSKQVIMKDILRHPIESGFNLFADIHLTSLIFNKLTNITFLGAVGKYIYKWEHVTVNACSMTKTVKPHPVFRPMILWYSSRIPSLFQDSRLIIEVEQYRIVSCHKEQVHWTSQLLELISPFDRWTWLLIFTMCATVSCIVKMAYKCQNRRNKNLFDVIFYITTQSLEQYNSLFVTDSKTTKASFYWCVFFVPITWLYLSTLYKGDNVTRLTAEPPQIQFDTFEMLENYQFNTYSIRYSLRPQYFYVKLNFIISEIRKLQKEFGSVVTHEALPAVSELWFRLMVWLKNYNSFKLCLNYLKDEISKQMWKYINNSAMLPDYGQRFYENIPTVLNMHMNKCNKSAMILHRPLAIQLHTLLKQSGKPSFLLRDKVLETFWGYKFGGHFPPNLVFRARHLFEAGVFDWWPRFLEYSLVLKTHIHGHTLMGSYNQNTTTGNRGSKTAVAVLTLIPGVGLLVSLFIFICGEKHFIKTLLKSASIFFSKCSSLSIKIFQHIWQLLFKLHVQKENIISINVQPKTVAF